MKLTRLPNFITTPARGCAAAIVLTALGFAGCTSTKERPNYAKYPHIHDGPTSTCYRAVLKAIPYTARNAFHARYGGSGNEGGLPQNAMDEIFRRHDIVYAEARSMKTMRAADAACVRALAKLDPATLTAKEEAFRQRAMSFFSDRTIFWVGKPMTGFLYAREPAGSLFKNQAVVNRFFDASVDQANAMVSPAREPGAGMATMLDHTFHQGAAITVAAQPRRSSSKSQALANVQ